MGRAFGLNCYQWGFECCSPLIRYPIMLYLFDTLFLAMKLAIHTFFWIFSDLAFILMLESGSNKIWYCQILLFFPSIEKPIIFIISEPSPHQTVTVILKNPSCPSATRFFFFLRSQCYQIWSRILNPIFLCSSLSYVNFEIKERFYII